MTIGAKNARSRPTSPVAVEPSADPIRRPTAVPPTAMATMTDAVRYVRRRARDVWRTNSSVNPPKQTPMNCPIGPTPSETVTIVARIRSRTMP